jgi:hypothetical protein
LSEDKQRLLLILVGSLHDEVKTLAVAERASLIGVRYSVRESLTVVVIRASNLDGAPRQREIVGLV